MISVNVSHICSFPHFSAKMEEAERLRVDMVRKHKEHDEMFAKMQEKLEQQRYALILAQHSYFSRL